MNNPTIDGVSRGLLETLVRPIRSALDESKRLDARKELRALLDAPVVERQPVAFPGYPPVPDDRKMAPPEVAALQSTIAQLEDKLNKAINLDFQRRETIEQLQAENERLMSGFFQQVNDEDLKKISDFVGDGDLPKRSFFMRQDAGDLANMTMHMVREVQSLRIRIAELESGRGAPVAWQYRVSAGPATGWSLWHDGKGDEFRNSYQVENRRLFTAPQAPVTVVLPEHIDSDLRSPVHGYARGWNACLDATAALNEVRR